MREFSQLAQNDVVDTLIFDEANQIVEARTYRSGMGSLAAIAQRTHVQIVLLSATMPVDH